MAWSKVTTEIANPGARKMAKHKTRRHLTARQIAAGFGGKRRKAASKRRHTKARRKPNAARRHTKARRKANAAPRRHAVARHTKRSLPRGRKASRRKNPELVSFLLGNPASRKGKKTMAKRKGRHAVARHTTNAGRRRKGARHMARRHHRNPAGIGSPKDWLFGGAGALAGFVGSAAVPQMFLGSSNVGVAGYAATAAAALGLALLSHFLMPRQTAVTFGVAAGGFANLLRRIITDQTPFGGYLSGTGMGDYMVANWGPPRMVDGLNSSMAEPIGMPWAGPTSTAMIASSGVSAQDLSDIGGRGRPC